MLVRFLKVVVALVAVPLLLVTTGAAVVFLINFGHYVETQGLGQTLFALLGVVVALPLTWVLTYYTIRDLEKIFGVFSR